jgi:hypothetical protein
VSLLLVVTVASMVYTDMDGADDTNIHSAATEGGGADDKTRLRRV